MGLSDAFEQFGVALGNLKRAYAEEFAANSNYVAIHIDDGNYVTIFSTDRSGSWTPIYREWGNPDSVAN